MNTGNKLNKPKKKSVSKSVVTNPATNKPTKSKAATSPKPVTLSKATTPTKALPLSKASTVANKSVSKAKKDPLPKGLSPKAPLPKGLSPKAPQKKAASAKKANAPIEEPAKLPPKVLTVKGLPPKGLAAKSVPLQHTKKRYTDLKMIIDQMRTNSNAANNFEDAYKIEGEGMTREEYKRRKK